MDVAAISEAIRIADELRGALIDEAGRSYTYETELMKRSIAEEDACELCDDCEAQGWIDPEDVFESGEDEPPHHINCKCQVQYEERRHRVYD